MNSWIDCLAVGVLGGTVTYLLTSATMYRAGWKKGYAKGRKDGRDDARDMMTKSWK